MVFIPLLVLLSAPATYADLQAPSVPAVAISNGVVMDGPDVGSEERLCPDMPACPEATQCPEVEVVCPIEGKIYTEFKALTRDSRRYMDFLRRESYFYLDDSSGDKVLEHLLEELEKYYFTYRDVPGSEEAQYLMARIYNKWKMYEHELTCLLKIIYEYPGGAFHKKARTDAMELLSGRLKKDLGNSPNILAGGRGKNRADDQAAMLENFVRFGSKKYLELQMRELGEFLAYYPRHPKSDLMMTFRANNYIRLRNYEAAAHTLRRLAAFYPKSPLRPESLYMLGTVYSENLGKYQGAVDVFLQLIEAHPRSAQAISSHERAAELYYRKLKEPEKAVDMLEALVERFPETDATLRGFTYMADILESSKKYKEAFDAFSRQSDMFAKRTPDAVTALFEAGRVAEKRLKDDRLFVETMLNVYKRYPKYERSAEALFEAALKYEKEFSDMENAKKYYRMVAGEFASHKLSRKASGRLDNILAREMKEELKRQKELEKQKQKQGGAR